MHQSQNVGEHARYRRKAKRKARAKSQGPCEAKRLRAVCAAARSAAHAWKGVARGEAIACNIIDMPFTNVGGYARCQAKERTGARAQPPGGARAERQLSFARQRSDFDDL